MIYTQSQPRAYWAWDSASQLMEAHTENQLWLYVYVRIEKSRRSKDRKNQDTNGKAPLEMSHNWGSHVGDRHSTHCCAPALCSAEKEEVTGRCRQLTRIRVLFAWLFTRASARWSVKTAPAAVCIHCSIIILGKTPWGGPWTAMPFPCISASSSDLIFKTNLTCQCLWRF